MWNNDEIRAALATLADKHGKHPTARIVNRSGLKGLDYAISQSGGYRAWRIRMGAPVRERWSNEKIQEWLVVEIAFYGRMPSSSEMENRGKSSLSNAVRRSDYSYREWANIMGTTLKVCETHRAYVIEEWVKGVLEKRGHSVTLTRTKEAYDLLVDGSIRVEVKMARDFQDPRYAVDAFIFSFGKHPEKRRIDFAVLVCVDADDTPLKTYVLPSAFAKQQTISITRSHRWTPFLEAWDSIRLFNQARPYLAR